MEFFQKINEVYGVNMRELILRLQEAQQKITNLMEYL